MSRQPRAGSAGKPVTIRATDAERKRWERAALVRDISLSDWIRPVLDREAEAVLRTVAKLARGNTVENTARSRRNPRRAKH